LISVILIRNCLLQLMKILFTLFLICLSWTGFAQSRTISSTTKSIVFSRDGGICQCCGSSDQLEFDHIMPFSCGGSNDASNVQLLCMRCNRSKSNSCYCKIHQRKVGINCCDGQTNRINHSTSSGYRRAGNSSSQCTGTTQKGARCRNMTTHPSRRCHHHQ
jgi:hypothetical protein